MRPGRLVIILIWVVGLLAGCAVIARTNFSSDMSAFLPHSPSPAQRILVDQLREGVVSRLILLAVEGAPADTLAALSKAMAKDLRADPAFGVVSNGDEAGFARDRELLWRYRFLLSPAIAPGHFGPVALHAALEADLGLLGSELSPLAKRSIPADPTGEMLRLIGAFSAQTHPAMRDGVWVSSDNRRALLMVQTVAAGFDIDAQEQALRRIEAAFAAARQHDLARTKHNAAQARLIKSGPPVFAVRTREQMKADVERLSLIATILVATILLFAYRSLRMLVLALLPVLSGVIAGIAAVSLAFGFVHGITLGFGVTLIGEAVDYAIYLFTQTAPGAALAATMPRIWSTLRLGMLTSICGFSAMLLSSFTGFAQLGLFTITGLVVALVVTRWVLPTLLPFSFTATSSTMFAIPVLILIRLGPALRYVVLGLTVAAGVLLAFHSGPYWDSELASMSSTTCRRKITGRSAAPRNRRPRCPLSPGRAGTGPGSGAGRKRACRCGPGTACDERHDHGLRRTWYVVAEPRDATHATGGVARYSDAQCQPDRGNNRHAVPPRHILAVPGRSRGCTQPALAATRGPERHQPRAAARLASGAGQRRLACHAVAARCVGRPGLG